MLDYLVVGSGFCGATCARLLAEAGNRVFVVEQRDYVGGNVADYRDSETGIIVSRVGPHYFHTNSRPVWDFVNRFAKFNAMVLRTRTHYKDRTYSFPPLNLLTLSEVFGHHFTPTSAQVFMAEHCKEFRQTAPTNYQQYMLAQLGPKMFEMFVKGYIQKAWDCQPAELPITLGRRIRIEYSFDDRVFDKNYQGYPIGGYAPLVSKMLAHRNIKLQLSTAFERSMVSDARSTIYSGMIDQFFDFELGHLPYRSLRFEHETVPESDFQGAPVINHTDAAVPYTRVTEHKHFCGTICQKSCITREYSIPYTEGEIPCYPVQNAHTDGLVRQYRGLMRQFPAVHFGGRLGSYKYLNMDETIAAAMKLSAHLCSDKL